MKMIDLTGKNILITGASSGLGRAISQMVASQGATVFLSGRNEEHLKSTLNSLGGAGHFIFPGDISIFSVIEQITKAIIEKNIKISGFVQSAGLEKNLPLISSNPSVFQEVFNVNVFAGFEFVRLLSRKNIVDPRGASLIFS